jgi:hypothetical protein
MQCNNVEWCVARYGRRGTWPDEKEPNGKSECDCVDACDWAVARGSQCEKKYDVSRNTYQFNIIDRAGTIVCDPSKGNSSG